MAFREDRAVQAMMGESGGDELWLISYADLLTLLVGFFVLLLAASPMKLARFEKLASAISGEQTAPLEDLKEKVDEFIQREKLQDQVSTREDAEGLAIEFKDALLFDSGSAQIRLPGQSAISSLAKMVKELHGRAVVIEGYTDDVPIKSAVFESNWELSSQRAINVLSALESAGVQRERMSVRGFADTKKITPNPQATLEELRAANRRVVIRVE